LSLYLVTYAANKPKTGHKPELASRVVEASSRNLAIRLFLQASENDVWSVQADWVGSHILKAEA
jgi:hypothetical protein